MSSVNGVSGARGIAGAMLHDVGAPRAARSTPTIAEPAMNPDAAASSLAGFEGLGLEAVAAALTVSVAQSQAQMARDEERAHAKEEHDAIARQVAAMHEKASALRAEGAVGAVIGIGGAAFSAVGTCSPVEKGRSANLYEVIGHGVSQSAEPIAKWSFGGRVVDRDADATAAGGAAKEAEAAKNDAAERRKVAEDAVEKAQSALQEFVQERAMARRAIFRG